jgi:hypothetical protein
VLKVRRFRVESGYVQQVALKVVVFPFLSIQTKATSSFKSFMAEIGLF